MPYLEYYFFVFPGFLSVGTGAASRVLARFLVLYDVPPECLGQPRSLGPITMETPEGEGGDDDRPEDVEAEVTHENQLEGEGRLFFSARFLSLFYLIIYLLSVYLSVRLPATFSIFNALIGLGELRSKFPNSLHQDILWASCAIECAAQWSAEKEVILRKNVSI